MARTTDKIVLSILAILFIGISGMFITALSSDDARTQFNANQLVIKDTNSRNINLAGFEEDNKDEKEDIAIAGTALDRASVVALAYIGKGRVTDTEVGDEEGYYEIEITLNDGSELDVHLDENFNVLSTEYEYEEKDD
ncbi:MAG: hypothetical protein AABY05_02800 [Nanoarchaeota archaeon]